MRIVRWSPSQDLISLREAMDRLFEESWTGTTEPDWSRRETTRAWRLPVDVHSTDEEIVIQAAVPGATAQDVEITIEGDTLIIRGELPVRPENVNYLLEELPAGRFHRALNLNIPVEASRAEATFANGVLTLIIPKAEAVRPRQIKVKTE